MCSHEPEMGRQRNSVRDIKDEGHALPPQAELLADKGEKAIRVGSPTVHFASDASRWLGIRLDMALALLEDRQRCIDRGKIGRG